MNPLNPIAWKDEKIFLIDQRLLPHTESWVEVTNLQECHDAIKDMVVRGAPCIGFTAIFGMALALKKKMKIDLDQIQDDATFLMSARPTAVNLAYEIRRCLEKIQSHESVEIAYLDLIKFGKQQLELSEKRNTQMAEYALQDLKTVIDKKKYNFMTHCNTGYLACGSLGTALGVISIANRKNMVEHVYADETRPYLQGSRLTAFELVKQDIPHSVVVEGAASYLMKHGKIDAIFIGADRIAANGDTANKIGSSTLAIVAKYYNVPFYVVAPTSSFDLSLESGREIEIEFRDPSEIKSYKKYDIAPHESGAVNPSFDITDNSMITGIICENGIIKAPYSKNLPRIVRGEES